MREHGSLPAPWWLCRHRGSREVRNHRAGSAVNSCDVPWIEGRACQKIYQPEFDLRNLELWWAISEETMIGHSQLLQTISKIFGQDSGCILPDPVAS